MHSVSVPIGFGGYGLKTKGRPLQVMVHLKRSIIPVKSETNSLAHALIIAISKITNDPDCKAYIKGRKIHRVFDNLLATTGISLINGVGGPRIREVSGPFNQYKIVVYTGQNCDSIMFERQIDTSERINFLYDVTQHFNVIGNLTAAMANCFVLKHVVKDVGSTHTCDQTWRVLHVYRQGFESLMWTNRHFRSQ
jgi:hypothetical protein